MGLDMYLSKVKRDEVAYWRKANAIHKWFEDHVADGELENCRDYYVSKEQLELLRNTCQKVIDSTKMKHAQVKVGERCRNGKTEPIYQMGTVMEDPSLAQELLPTKHGFFFGGTDYDKFYMDDLKETVEMIDKVLKTTDFENEDVYYHASW